MTPEFRTALRTLGLTGREFCAMVGVTDDTLTNWGRRTPEPPWAWLLIRAWTVHPEALETERERVAA